MKREAFRAFLKENMPRNANKMSGRFFVVIKIYGTDNENTKHVSSHREKQTQKRNCSFIAQPI